MAGVRKGRGRELSKILRGKIRQENVFENILERNKAFPDDKNKKLKKSKIWPFPKGLVHGFS